MAERPRYFPHTIDLGSIGCVAMILEMYGSGDDTVCGIYQMCGHIHCAPKLWLRVVRDQMQKIEQMARESGVSEMRVAGRSWSRVLPDYEPFEEVPNGLRKKL